MSMQICAKQQFIPRQKKLGPYEMTNTYTQKPSHEQVITLLLFIAQLALHSIFIVPPMDDIKKEILWVLLGFHYTLLIVTAYDYVYLTTMDPVDRLITNQQFVSRLTQEDVTFCTLCNCYVQVNSHHCLKCHRCTEQFDHHCKYLNNCIGGLNYESFFRLLSIYTLYNLNIIGQCIWVFNKNIEDKEIAFEGNQWGVLFLLIVTVILTLVVGGLLVFHIYISVFEMTTTLQYNYPQNKSKDVENVEPLQRLSIKIYGVDGKDVQVPASSKGLNTNYGKAGL